MIMFNDIKPIEVIETIVSRMRYSGDITDISADGDEWTITATNCNRLNLGEYVIIDNITYQITSLTTTSFNVVGSEPSGSEWTSQSPSFYHGTPVKVDADMYQDLNGNEMKFPFICLFEPLKSRLFTSRENPIGEDVELWLIFMDKSRTDLTTDQHHSIIDNMYNLMTRFISECEKSSDIVEVSDDLTLDVIRHAEYGLIAKTKGHEKYLLNNNLSGVEIENYTLRIKKTYC